MATPTLQILGVYRPVITDEIFKEQNEVYGNEAETRDHFRGLVLIEAVADGIDERFQMMDFQQVTPEGGEQAAYDEGLLSSDGSNLLKRDLDCVAGPPPLRFAFYIHYCDPERPIRWTYGEVYCPSIQEMPERLQKLMPYRPTS